MKDTRDPAVRRLRRRFITWAFLAFAVLMLLLTLALNLANHQLVRRRQMLVLETLADHGGFLPRLDTLPDDAADPEALHRARYFAVYYQEAPRRLLLRTRRVASLDEAEILTLASEALAGDAARGEAGPYRFLRRESALGALIIFLDVTQDRLVVRQMLLFSLLACSVLLLLLLLILRLFADRAVAPIVRSMEKQRRFITDAGHELKTPLAVLRANLDVVDMLRGEDEWSRSSRTQIDRLNHRLEQLLTLSRLDEQAEAPEQSDVDLAARGRAWIDAVQPLFQKRDVTATVDSARDPWLWTGPADDLEEIASILMDNAAKYTLAGGHFRLQLRELRDRPVLDFTNGADVDAEALPHLFDRFYRASSAETEGSGIGLSIVDALAKRAGITVEAVPGDGTLTFRVSLPKSASQIRES